MPYEHGFSEAEIRSKHSEDIQELKRKLIAKDKQINEYRASHGSILALFDSIKDSIPLYPNIKVQYTPPKIPNSKAACGVCLLICDTHYGAIQIPSEIEGFGEYSPEICEGRSMKFVHEVVRWTKLNRQNYNIDTAYVLVAGDLISGDIHAELQITNAFPAPQQVFGSARILANQILTLAPHFKKVVVHFVTEDNHARLTKKPQAKEAGINSFNYLVGKIASVMLKQNSNVQFNIYPQYETVVNVEGRKYLLMHGHGVMGWAGTPWYGLDRKVAKEAIKRLTAPDFNRFNKVVMGHWHTPISSPYYWVGGSVSGTDAYDHKNGRHSEPSQASWIVGKRGEFGRVDWNLQK